MFLISYFLQSDDYGCILTTGLCDDTAQRFGKQVHRLLTIFLPALFVTFFLVMSIRKSIKNNDYELVIMLECHPLRKVFLECGDGGFF